MEDYAAKTALWSSFFLGLGLGCYACHTGMAQGLPFYRGYKSWTYGFTHVFLDFFHVPHGATKLRKLAQILSGFVNFCSGVCFIVALLMDMSGLVSYLTYDTVNAVIVCIGAEFLMICMVEVLIRYVLVARMGQRCRSVCAFSAVLVFICLRLTAVPLETMSANSVNGFYTCVAIALLVFLLVTGLHFCKGEMSKNMQCGEKAASAAFTHFLEDNLDALPAE